MDHKRTKLNTRLLKYIEIGKENGGKLELEGSTKTSDTGCSLTAHPASPKTA